MTTTPTGTPAQRIADLQDALRDAVRWLAYAAGHAATTDPVHAEQLLEAVGELETVLARTRP
jgi:hypothetical protein